jgi:hypothetical protein
MSQADEYLAKLPMKLKQLLPHTVRRMLLQSLAMGRWR